MPGSKSLANRALLVAALADGRSELTNLPSAGDTTCMVDALTALGVSVRYQPSSSSASIVGAHGLWRADDVDLDVRDAGTVYRFVTAAACIGHGRYRIDGTPRIRERPIGGLVEALRALGARVDYDDAPGRCPLSIDAAGLDGGTVRLSDPASSQFLSALLMAAPLARRDVFIEVSGALRSRPYVDLTRRVMEAFGVSFVWDDQDRFVVPGNQHYQAAAYAVEPDASGAAYF
ncbi:MAG: 3-phosphoshikimate 1-carboxyvinyltransferase, partial [Phycisphaerae bacterium]